MKDDSIFNLEYLKNEFSQKDYINLINDVNANYLKYRKALYNYYKSNGDKFPFEDYDFANEVILILFLNEHDYDKNIALKVLDNMFLTINNGMHKVLILNFLCGFGVINKDEMDKRNPYNALINK